MRGRVFTWLLAPMLVGGVAYLLVAVPQCRSWLGFAEAPPTIDYPAELDLGDGEVGDLVVSRYTIANRGGRELIIDGIRTNCSCTGMECEQEGKYVRVDALRIKAGDQAELVLRVSVGGVPIGAQMRNVVEFQTNDPAHPRGRIEAVVRRVSGGIFTVPESVIAGTVVVGSEVRRVVEVRDPALHPRRVEEVSSTAPERVRVRLLPDKDQSRDGVQHPEGTVIGYLEVTVAAEKSGPIQGAIIIKLQGETRPPHTVPVVGHVAAPIDLSPALLVLPRMSSGGPIYTATCICRSNNGEPLSVDVSSVPLGLSVELLESASPSVRTIQVTLDREHEFATGDGRRAVRLLAKAGEDEAVLEVEVLIQPRGG